MPYRLAPSVFLFAVTSAQMALAVFHLNSSIIFHSCKLCKWTHLIDVNKLNGVERSLSRRTVFALPSSFFWLLSSEKVDCVFLFFFLTAAFSLLEQSLRVFWVQDFTRSYFSLLFCFAHSLSILFRPPTSLTFYFPPTLTYSFFISLNFASFSTPFLRDLSTNLLTELGLSVFNGSGQLQVLWVLNSSALLIFISLPCYLAWRMCFRRSLAFFSFALFFSFSFSSFFCLVFCSDLSSFIILVFASNYKWRCPI